MPRVFVFLVLLVSQHSPAADFGGYVTLTTDYVKRGVTQSDSNPALQLAAEVGFDNGLFLGVWSSTVDIDNGRHGREIWSSTITLAMFLTSPIPGKFLSAPLHMITRAKLEMSITTTRNTFWAAISKIVFGLSLPIRQTSTTPGCHPPTSTCSPNGRSIASGHWVPASVTTTHRILQGVATSTGNWALQPH